jgi:type III secretion protein U
VPVVVCKGHGETGSAMLAEAGQLGIPIVDNAAFVTALAARHAVGDTIVSELFQVAAETLVAAGFS